MSRGPRKNAAHKRRQRGVVLLTVLGLLALIGLIVLLVLGWRINEKFEGRRWTLPARVYAVPLELYVGLPIDVERFTSELARLGYEPNAKATRPGTYHRRGDRVEVHSRAFRFADSEQPAQRLTLRFEQGVVTTLSNDRGRDVPIFRLDPLLIGSIHPTQGEDRLLVGPEQVPALLPEALKAVEDRKFERHHGVDPEAILRAAVANVRAGQVEQGGSTLTQQLVKSYFLDSRRTLGRKIEEAAMAVILDARYEKADIMNAYINEIYLGQDGSRAIHGFGLASQFYFGKPLEELKIHEIALMVAIVRGPSYYDPRRQPERALERRNLVLRLLGEQGLLTTDEVAAATRRPLDVIDHASQRRSYYPAFLDLVRRQLRTDYEDAVLTEAGLTVFSTFDPLVQADAERALREALVALDKSPKKQARGLEGAVVVTTPQTGEVVAIVAGRKPSVGGFNRALDAKRHIGSLAKPMAYLAALQTGEFTPATLLRDQKISLKNPDGTKWEPENFDRRVYGSVTMVRALSQSLNLATVNMALDAGLKNVARTYVELGLEEAPPAYPSLPLGAVNLSPVEVAQLYNTLANGGFRAPLRAVRAVLDEQGKPIKAPELEVEEPTSAEAVYALERMMIQVMERGTGRGAKDKLPQGLTVAGKTGTSNDYRDSWFAGFSGGHLIVVWMGHDDNRPTGLTGTTGALTAWTPIMAGLNTSSFEPVMPETMDERWIEYYSGRETSPNCSGSAVAMPFMLDTPLPQSEQCPPGSGPRTFLDGILDLLDGDSRAEDAPGTNAEGMIEPAPDTPAPP
jgi:penicillin-binding protein 1B